LNLNYAAESGTAFEKDHWWVRSRFGMLDRVLAGFHPTDPLRVLEIGCGTGVNLDYLSSRYGARLAQLIGVDPAAPPSGRPNVRHDIPDQENFDLILAMDVLEHVPRPVELLTQLRSRLKPSGRLLVTVPAFSWLWTAYDVMAHHQKRYALKELESELRAAGFDLLECFFLFGALFPFFLIQRLALRWRKAGDARLFRPTAPWLNGLFYHITAWESRFWAPKNRWFGSSLVAIARPGATV